ncbi:MAG: DNA replication and repair protein RecF [Myxococcota bacterium]|nr:DNA replication and repair protein RecF [Myxococcota bacterium]MDW8362097.1 DNA replication and repair protein RecF [Myxococcales bacterium]
MSAALRIARLELRAWRNLDAIALEPHARFTVLWGDNGAGKTSVLEAVGYVARLESFRGASAVRLVRDGEPCAHVVALAGVQHEPPHRIEVTLEAHGTRRVRVDERRPPSHRAHRARFPTVVFQPVDALLAVGAPEARRHWLDELLGLLDPAYATALEAYGRALRSRNRLLRRPEAPDPRALDAYEALLDGAAVVLGRVRASSCAWLGPSIARDVEAIAGEAMRIQVRHAPRVEPESGALRARLAASRELDRARGFTADGPHADDIAIEIRQPRGPVAARHHASQGQRRALGIALRLAEARLLERRLGTMPVLLLDDVSSELDRTRAARLFGLLDTLSAQVLVTTTSPKHVPLDADALWVHVRDGRLVERTSRSP